MPSSYINIGKGKYYFIFQMNTQLFQYKFWNFILLPLICNASSIIYQLSAWVLFNFWVLYFVWLICLFISGPIECFLIIVSYDELYHIISYHIIVGQDSPVFFFMNVLIVPCECQNQLSSFKTHSNTHMHTQSQLLHPTSSFSPPSFLPISYFYINCCILIPYLLSR